MFPQFRSLSGLAGGGYGLDSEGYASLSGATAFSTPVAHVLGHNQWRVGLARTGDFRSSGLLSRVNGTSFITFGTTVGRLNIALTDMVLSRHFDQAFHLQVQYILPEETRWAASVGVQDIGGGGGAAGTSVPGDARSSRSYFGVVTYRIDTRQSPIYLSAGIGRRRFQHFFHSASYQVVRPLRVWVEQDGFGWSAGLLLSHRAGEGRRAVEYNALVGFLEGRFLTLAVGIGF